MPFKKTEERSKVLLTWSIEDNKELNQLYKDKVHYIDNNDMLKILDSRINCIRDSLQFYFENIVVWHLNHEELKEYYKVYPSKIDNTVNYMM